MLNISIIDCAIKKASHACFNQLVDQFDHKFHYHHPPREGLGSLKFQREADAYIVFGSASNVEDNFLWQRELANFCHEKLNKGLPVLGICFGHQLLGHAFGLDVKRNAQEARYNSTRDIEIQNECWGLKKGETFHLFVAHSFCLDENNREKTEVEVVGSSSECALDLITHKTLPFLGVQGHPEASDIFIADEINSKDSEKIQRAKRDGLRLIRHFVQSCEKFQHNL